LLRVSDPAADNATLSERVDEQVEGDAAKAAADKVRQRKMMLNQSSETFMVQMKAPEDGEAASDQVVESVDPKARARKGMIGRNPTILVRMEEEEADPAGDLFLFTSRLLIRHISRCLLVVLTFCIVDGAAANLAGNLARQVDELIADEAPPDPKASARMFMIGRTPTLQDVHDMIDRDEVVRMEPEEEAAALEELREAGLIKSGEQFIICTGSAASSQEQPG